jgi:hypothetical protein
VQTPAALLTACKDYAMPFSRIFITVIIPACLLLLVGCATSSVRHLARLPVIQNQEQTLTTRYWTFRFSAAQNLTGDRLTITGTAVPDRTDLPQWGTWTRTLNLAAYLCNDQGTVLTQQSLPYPPRPLSAHIPVPFEFSMDLPRGNDIPLSLSFGYSMEVTRKPEHPEAEKDTTSGMEEVFFASQKALLQ